MYLNKIRVNYGNVYLSSYFTYIHLAQHVTSDTSVDVVEATTTSSNAAMDSITSLWSIPPSHCPADMMAFCICSTLFFSLSLVIRCIPCATTRKASFFFVFQFPALFLHLVTNIGSHPKISIMPICIFSSRRSRVYVGFCLYMIIYTKLYNSVVTIVSCITVTNEGTQGVYICWFQPLFVNIFCMLSQKAAAGMCQWFGWTQVLEEMEPGCTYHTCLCSNIKVCDCSSSHNIQYDCNFELQNLYFHYEIMNKLWVFKAVKTLIWTSAAFNPTSDWFPLASLITHPILMSRIPYNLLRCTKLQS